MGLVGNKNTVRVILLFFVGSVCVWASLGHQAQAEGVVQVQVQEQGQDQKHCLPTAGDESCSSALLQQRMGKDRAQEQLLEEGESAGAGKGSGARAGAVAVADDSRAKAQAETQTQTQAQSGNAIFLMQATFGPTRESLGELAGKSYKDWILEQIALEPSMHRDYYRARVSPASDPTNQVGFTELPVCAKGSRWQKHALSGSDVGLPITIADKAGGGKEVLVDGFWRTDLDPAHIGNEIAPTACTSVVPWGFQRKGKTCNQATRGQCDSDYWVEQRLCQRECFTLHGTTHSERDDCSGGWPTLNGGSLTGYICSIAANEKGAMVSLSTSSNCRSLIYARNPVIWVSNPGTIDTQLPFESNPRVPGVLFLASDSGATCGLTRGGIMRTGGSVYIHSPRMVLKENTPSNPLAFDAANCPTMTIFNEKTCVVLPDTVEGCPLACGSPGEVANEPKEGHLFTMHTVDFNDKDPDTHVDSRFTGNVRYRRLSKSTVWTMRALQAKDQLRQRVAWALSQILVTGSAGVEDDRMTELWLVYYDFFVRHGFGNYIDLLREVTYSPLMGDYLSYSRSRSYDTSRSYPDENYAREIMQLFSIGLFVLHPNGTAIVDAQGNGVPTYTNEQIMNFARVFTGFNPRTARANLELWKATKNMIDPMYIYPDQHDQYPKPDLYGGFLGDSHPLCSDLPTKSFLLAGAKYRFMGYSYSDEEEVLDLPSDSPLFSQLCAGAPGACAFNAIVELSESLLDSCQGPECEASSVDVVKVGTAFYAYIPPPCVHLFFFNGKYVKTPTSSRLYCASPHLAVAATVCSAGCTNKIPGGPNGWFASRGFTCENADQNWLRRGQPIMTTSKCNMNRNYRYHRYCELTCAQAGVGYDGSNCSAGLYREELQCDHKYEFKTYQAARAHCASRGLSLGSNSVEGRCASDIYTWTTQDCGMDVQVHADGKVSAHTSYPEANRFSVMWTSGSAPAAGTYPATVELKAVFDKLPTQSELLASLKVGAFPATGSCTAGCDGVVKAYGSGGFDVDTVFECHGRYFRNVESVVHVAGASFRNPPAFLPPVPHSRFKPSPRRQVQAVENEVESLLQHLMQHPSTPGSICKKLIQRFTTSNPSPDYLAAVTEAFRTGQYDGTVFTGQLGDVGAAVAAILLHPEARSQTARDSGLLREPMLKMMHVLRSMAYTDVAGQDVVLETIQNRIGQFPYHSPSVFNFFNADYMPARFRKSEPEPEPEPEPLVAPEFQVFTSPMAMNFLNGMAALLKDGVSHCGEGFALRDYQKGCERGDLTFTAANDSAAAVDELNLMLTGGRLSAEGLAIVKRVYETASESERLEKAQQAILFTPEFNNLGDPKPAGTRTPPTPAPAGGQKDYKAVVMLFMHGGADTFHMLVPLCHLFNEYKDVRGGAAHAQDQLHPIRAGSAQTCGRFGLHPDLHFLSDLYETRKHAAFISNIGALVEPVTRATLKQKRKCEGMYSHSHQQSAAQTLDCAVRGGALGVGGRLGDALAGLGYRVESFSVAGTATWSGGETTKMEIVDKSGGAVRFQGYEEWSSIIGNITRQTYGNVYCEEYAASLGEAVESSNSLGNLLESVALETDFPATTGLAQQLKQVAKLIAARAERQAERDFFFVQLGGFDTHAGLFDTFSAKMVEIDNALASFVAELEAQGSFDDTILLSASDFGRTLTFNGQGTDHGWGGNHFVLGGKVRGRQILNSFPRTLVPENDYDAGRGRVIPEYPWESMMVPIAEWLGVSAVEEVFPNLGNFNRSHHILSQSSLFHA